MFQDEATGVRPKGWLKRGLEALVEEPVTEGSANTHRKGRNMFRQTGEKKILALRCISLCRLELNP